MGGLVERLRRFSPERRLYTLEHLPTHLAGAGQRDRLRQMLTAFEFLQAKLEALGPEPLLADYNLALPAGADAQNDNRDGDGLLLLQRSIRLSALVLAQDTNQFAGQLLGRLMSRQEPEVQTVLSQARQWAEGAWLRPLTRSLASPEEPVQRILTGHTGTPRVAAITPDGRRAVSYSPSGGDKKFRVWDLEGGTPVSMFPM